MFHFAVLTLMIHFPIQLPARLTLSPGDTHHPTPVGPVDHFRFGSPARWPPLDPATCPANAKKFRRVMGWVDIARVTNRNPRADIALEGYQAMSNTGRFAGIFH